MDKALERLEDLKVNSSQKCTVLVRWKQVHTFPWNSKYYKSEVGKYPGDSIKEECSKCIFFPKRNLCLSTLLHLCWFLVQPFPLEDLGTS